MTKYKLVPVEPTPEMIEADLDAEPVAWAYQWKTGEDRSWTVTTARWPDSDEWYEYPLYTAPQPAKPAEQEPFTVLVRKHSWLPSQWEAAPCGFPDYGKQWADERINVYTAPQTAKREPLSQYAIDRIVGSLQVQWPDYFDLEAATKFARAIEAAHGIGSLCDSGMANTATDTIAGSDLDNLLKSAKKLLKELDVLREADLEKEDWMPVNEADDALRAAIAKVEGRS